MCVCRSIKPFDIAELPTHLKGCSTAKQKENFRECAQMAVEAARLSRRATASVAKKQSRELVNYHVKNAVLFTPKLATYWLQHPAIVQASKRLSCNISCCPFETTDVDRDPSAPPSLPPTLLKIGKTCRDSCGRTFHR